MERLGHRVSASLNLIRYYKMLSKVIVPTCILIRWDNICFSMSPTCIIINFFLFLPIPRKRNGMYLFKFACIWLFMSLSLYFLLVGHSSFLFCELFIFPIMLTFAERLGSETQRVHHWEAVYCYAHWISVHSSNQTLQSRKREAVHLALLWVSSI